MPAKKPGKRDRRPCHGALVVKERELGGGGGEHDAADRVHRRRVERIDQAADRRPGDGGNLLRDRRGRHRPREQAYRHDAGQDRLHGRRFAGAAGAEEEGGREDQLLAGGAGEGAVGERRRRAPFDELRDLRNAPAVVAVGELAGDQQQDRRGQELHQPDQAEVERRAGQRIHLPAHRHADHLEREVGGHPRGPEQDERPVADERHRRGIDRTHEDACIPERGRERDDSPAFVSTSQPKPQIDRNTKPAFAKAPAGSLRTSGGLPAEAA